MWLNQLVKQNNDFKKLKKQEKYVFSSWIWINPELGVPVRYLSYLLPIIESLNQYKNSVWQIYFADKTAIDLGIKSEIVTENLKQYKELASWFVEEFYPKDKWKKILTDEKVIDKEKIITQENLIKEMIKIIVSENDSQINNFAEKRWKKALEYMVKHSLYMRDNVSKDEDLFLIDNPEWFENEKVVMIWWPAEKIFYKVRQILVNNLGKPNWNLQLFTDIWRLPPYYSKFMENVFWEKIKQNSFVEFSENINKELLYDYLMLIISCSSSQDYSIIKRRKKFNEDDFELLEEWFQNLKIFLKQF